MSGTLKFLCKTSAIILRYFESTTLTIVAGDLKFKQLNFLNGNFEFFMLTTFLPIFLAHLQRSTFGKEF